MVARQYGGKADKPLNETFDALPTTIFTVMTNLANEHGSVNLGQGFPDDEGPRSMKDLVGKSVSEGPNQYTNLQGIPEARQAVARHSKDFSGLSVDWQSQTLLTAGATEALAATFLALVNPGDEVIILDPMYDAYSVMAERAGAVVVPVKLNENDWSIPEDNLEAAFSERTKLILVNTPHNPTGKAQIHTAVINHSLKSLYIKACIQQEQEPRGVNTDFLELSNGVFSRSDLEHVAHLVEKYNAYAVLDEVYEHLVFDGAQHLTLRSLPGMEDRAIRIGSAGKTFSFTGWKIGWVTGPPRLIAAIGKAHSFLVFCLSGSLQKAVGFGLDNEREFIRSMPVPFCLLSRSSSCRDLGVNLANKRRFLTDALTEIGFRILPAQGTYFLIADFRPLMRDGTEETDVEFAIRLTKEAGVTVIPVSAFYVSKQKPQHLVRFCFCKSDEKLKKAAEQLQSYFKSGS